MDYHRSLPDRITLWVAGIAACVTGIYSVAASVLIDRVILVHEFKNGALTSWIALTVVAWLGWFAALVKGIPHLRWLLWVVMPLGVAAILALLWSTLGGTVDTQVVNFSKG
ncbi:MULTISPECIES: hypothetical protein [Streptomyces albovinaceus subgroup]|uniref:hypothetical protein n=1 Tax=Streptomyces albovinaceus subgroup TaxID=1482558 RepID=UPI0011805503|nr:hypothetical protein [Streptomyces albovinaceus]GGW17653.1 hypothetical protein GCM10010264_74110 [Streptomyces globisporus]